MKQRGGYDVILRGRPIGNVEVLPEPAHLLLPLRSRSFAFTDVCVQDGQQVRPGHVLAVDPEQFSVPLLAPRAGTVDLSSQPDHIVLADVARGPEEPYDGALDAPHVPKAGGASDVRRRQLVDLGAWQFVQDVYTGQLPDPFGTPQAVIVSMLHLEPFASRGDAQVRKRLSWLTRGLEHIQSLLEYQPIYLVVPNIQSELANEVRQIVRGYAFVQMVQIPLKYPFDHFRLLARQLGLKEDPEYPVWAMRTEGALAIDRALTLSLPCTVRIVSLGGPAALNPSHLKIMPGYPLKQLLAGRTQDGPVRILSGGALTGRIIPDEQLGLDSECMALTVLSDEVERKFVGFLRPGLGKQSFHRGFTGNIRRALGGGFAEALSTATRGERRACIACGACEDVCPAGIWPHLIHKRIEGEDSVDPAAEAGVELCVDCGLCSYVCPSKIELADQFAAAKGELVAQRQEDEEARLEAEAEAAAAEAEAAERPEEDVWT